MVVSSQSRGIATEEGVRPDTVVSVWSVVSGGL